MNHSLFASCVKKKIISLLVLLIAIAYHGYSQSCNPMYIRVHYGQQFTISSLTNDNLFQRSYQNFPTKSNISMIIKFNTQISCKKSYVSIVKKLEIHKFTCTQSILSIQSNNQYIQSCLIEVPQDQLQFQYRITPLPTLQQQAQHQLFSQNQNQLKEQKQHQWQQSHTINDITYTVNLPTQNNINLIAFSNWGAIKTKSYHPITSSLQTLVQNVDKKQPIHGIIINGDLFIAYNTTNKPFQTYQNFMQQLSQISPYVPLIIIPGSRQSLISSNLEILSKTFQIYNIRYPTRVQAYIIGPLCLLTYDPFLEYFNKATPEDSYTLIKNIKKVLNKFQTQKNFIKIVTTNYPLGCSQNISSCLSSIKYFPQIIQLFDKSQMIDLYIGGHQTQYERIAPFKNGKFNPDLKQPYKRGQMVSVVQGAAGNDQYIVDSPYQRKDYSVIASYNKTGFGLISIQNGGSSYKVDYFHYFVEPNLTIFDKFTIQGSAVQKRSLFKLQQ